MVVYNERLFVDGEAFLKTIGFRNRPKGESITTVILEPSKAEDPNRSERRIITYFQENGYERETIPLKGYIDTGVTEIFNKNHSLLFAIIQKAEDIEPTSRRPTFAFRYPTLLDSVVKKACKDLGIGGHVRYNNLMD